MDKKEKVFYINTSKVPGYRKEKEVKESELTEEDCIYLWNKLVLTFDEMPVMVQIRFAKELSDIYKSKLQEALKQPIENESNTNSSESVQPDNIPGNVEVPEPSN